MRPWTEGFHQQLREVLHEGQQDLYGELDIVPPYRPHVRCRKCGTPWEGADARSTPAKARERGVWYVSHSKVVCPTCQAKEQQE